MTERKKHPLGNMFNPPPLGNKFCKRFFFKSQNLSGNSFLFLLDHSLNTILGVESSSHIGCSFTFSTNPVSTWCICKTHTLKMKPRYRAVNIITGKHNFQTLDHHLKFNCLASHPQRKDFCSKLWLIAWYVNLTHLRQLIITSGAHILSSLTSLSSRDYTWKSLGILAPFHCSHKMVWGRNGTEAIKDVTYGARVQ